MRARETPRGPTVRPAVQTAACGPTFNPNACRRGDFPVRPVPGCGVAGVVGVEAEHLRKCVRGRFGRAVANLVEYSAFGRRTTVRIFVGNGRGNIPRCRGNRLLSKIRQRRRAVFKAISYAIRRIFVVNSKTLRFHSGVPLFRRPSLASGRLFGRSPFAVARGGARLGADPTSPPGRPGRRRLGSGICPPETASSSGLRDAFVFPAPPR